MNETPHSNQLGYPVNVVQQFLDDLEARGRSTITQMCYRADLEQFMAWLRAEGLLPLVMDWNTIERHHILAYIQYLELQYKANTVKRRTIGVSSFFDFLIRTGRAGHNPALPQYKGEE